MFAVSRETANIKNNKAPNISSSKNKIDAIQQNQRNTTPFDGQHNGIAQKQSKMPLCFDYLIIPLPYPLENRKVCGFSPKHRISIPKQRPSKRRLPETSTQKGAREKKRGHTKLYNSQTETDLNGYSKYRKQALIKSLKALLAH